MGTIPTIRYIVGGSIVLLGILFGQLIENKTQVCGNTQHSTRFTDSDLVKLFRLNGIHKSGIRSVFETAINFGENLKSDCDKSIKTLSLLNREYNRLLEIITNMQSRPKRSFQSHCNPQITEGDHTQVAIGGFMFFECDISTCDSMYKLEFQKRVTGGSTWMAVFEWINGSLDHAVETGDVYTLKNRTEYAIFPTQHTLSINALTLEDNGGWRCVVHAADGGHTSSNTMELYLAPKCKPIISEGHFTKLQIDGHTSLVCDISSCASFKTIRFEKKLSAKDTTWTPAYESNGTAHHAIKTDEYALENRNSYANFTTRHILDINPLELQDQGKWRCVVFDKNNKQTESEAKTLYMHSTDADTLNPSLGVVVANNSWKFLCEVHNLQLAPYALWTVNGSIHETGVVNVYKSDIGLWNLKVITELPFYQVGKTTVDCEIRYLMKPEISARSSITVDVENITIDFSSTQSTKNQCLGQNLVIGTLVLSFLLLVGRYICKTVNGEKKRTHDSIIMQGREPFLPKDNDETQKKNMHEDNDNTTDGNVYEEYSSEFYRSEFARSGHYQNAI